MRSSAYSSRAPERGGVKDTTLSFMPRTNWGDGITFCATTGLALFAMDRFFFVIALLVMEEMLSERP